MLSPGDAELVRRDRAVPGLSVLLDPDALREALASHLAGDTLRDVRVTYVRYKPWTNCLAACRASSDAGEVDLYVKAHGVADAAWKLEKARRRPALPTPWGTGPVVLEGSRLEASILPNEPGLTTLARVWDPAERAGLLRRALPVAGDPDPGTLARLSYKAGRRWVGRLDAANTVTVARVYTEAGFRDTYRLAKGLVSADGLRLPRRLGRSPKDLTVLYEWLPGRPLGAALTEAKGRGHMRRLGAALARLHAQRPKHLEPLEPRAEAAAALSAVSALAFLSPDLAAFAHELAWRIVPALMAEPRGSSTIHGDLHAGQILLDGDDVALLDLDRAARGDPSCDLAMFLAHLEREAAVGAPFAGRVAELRAALLDGYRETAPGSIREEAVKLRTAATLLRLSVEPFRRRAADWPTRCARILERVRHILDARRRALAPSRERARAGVHVRDPVVEDAFEARHDPEMPFLAGALHPERIARELEAALGPGRTPPGSLSVEAIRVVRHKPGRRCLVEYRLRLALRDGPTRRQTLLGKARARALDSRTYELTRALWQRGFDEDSPDGVSVPEPLGAAPELHMWFQVKVRGTPATRLLEEPGGEALAVRMAGAVHKVHASRVRPLRRPHRMADELAALESRLALLARLRPGWAARLDRVYATLARCAADLPAVPLRPIHRDFHPEQALDSGGRLYLLDFDLCCPGDPSMDVGNLVAHLTEHALRHRGDPSALLSLEGAAVEEHCRLQRRDERRRVEVYALLTLARHLYISRQFADRQGTTEPLLDLLEARLDLTRTGRRRCGGPAVVWRLPA